MKRILVFLCAWLVSFFSYSQDLLSQQKAERLFSTGIDLVDHNQYGAAREVFSEYLSTSIVSDARRAEAAYYKAFCALNLYHTDSEKQIEDFIKDYPTHPKAITANYDLGNFYYAEKNFKKASLYYTKVDFSGLSQEQQRIGRFRWGYSLFNQKFLKESLEQFNYNKTIGGEYGPASSYYAGFIEYSQGDYTNALIDLKRAEQNEAYSKIVPYLIANVYYRQKNYDELISYATKVSTVEGVSSKEEIALLSAEAYSRRMILKMLLLAISNILKEGKKRQTRELCFGLAMLPIHWVKMLLRLNILRVPLRIQIQLVFTPRIILAHYTLSKIKSPWHKQPLILHVNINRIKS